MDHPDSLRAARQLALVLKRQGNFAGAEELYRQVNACRQVI